MPRASFAIINGLICILAAKTTAGCPVVDYVSILRGSGQALVIKIRGTLAYVASTVGLAIYDVSGPSDPLLVTTFAGPLGNNGQPAHAVELVGDDRVVLAYNSGRVDILDIQDPRSPVRLAVLPLPSCGYLLRMSGLSPTECLVTACVGVHKVDAYALTIEPIADFTTLTGFHPLDVAWLDGQLAVASLEGLSIYDGLPGEVTSYDALVPGSQRATAVVAGSDYFLATTTMGVPRLIVVTRDRETMQAVQVPSSPSALLADGNDVYIGGYQNVSLVRDYATNNARLCIVEENNFANWSLAVAQDRVFATNRILSLGQPGPATCSPADFAEAFNTLDINDILAFASAFNAMEPAADFFADGIFDINDILTFAEQFNAGCP